MLLSVENLCFSYGKKKILDGVGFGLEKGECLVVAGANGSGKSTLLSLLSGVLKPGAGRISAEGRIALVPQGSAVFEDMSVGWNMDFFASLYGVKTPEELPLGVSDLMETKVSKLSGGQRKRVSIACALIAEPDIVLLDEPAAGLDYVNRQDMRRIVSDLKRQGRTVVYVSHDPAEFGSFYDKLLYLKGGRGRLFEKSELSGADGSAETRELRLAAAFEAICSGPDMTAGNES